MISFGDRMAFFGVRLPADLAERLKAQSHSLGGTPAGLLRVLVERHLGEGGSQRGGDVVTATERRASKLTLRLRADELSAIEEMARERGLTRTAWVTGLVRARLFNRPVMPVDEDQVYRRAVSELHRIGINLNQIARAMNTAVMEGQLVRSEAQSIEEARKEIRQIAADLRQALNGQLDYWRGTE